MNGHYLCVLLMAMEVFPWTLVAMTSDCLRDGRLVGRQDLDAIPAAATNNMSPSAIGFLIDRELLEAKRGL